MHTDCYGLDYKTLCQPAGLLARSRARRHTGGGVPRVLLCTQRLASEAGGLFDLQGHRDRGDGEHDRLIAVHSYAERHKSQAGQQTGEQLKRHVNDEDAQVFRLLDV